MYRPFAQSFWPFVGFAVRGSGDPSALTRPAMEAIWAFDKDLPVDRAVTMDAMAAETLALRRLVTLLLTGFGAVGLILAVLALYGTIAYEVGQRGPEIAIRRALGAQSSSILWLIGRHGVVLLVIGQVLGIAAGLLSTRALSRLLFETPIHDPATFTGVVVIVTSVSLAATLIPPLLAIRREVGPALRVI
jgi:putative ABC transport system permease protein